MKQKKLLVAFFLFFMCNLSINACSIFYYIDSKTGKIYFINNEDYYYDTKPYIQIIPKSKNEYGRIWYGWNNFGQGGVNEKGLVIDGASTPLQKIPSGYKDPKHGNMTDKILATCASVDEAILYLEKNKIALRNAHIFLGDKNKKAIIIEWVNGVKHIVEIKNNRLVATNFNLSNKNEPTPNCWRYPIIQKGLDELDAKNTQDTIDLKMVGNVIGKVVQLPQKDTDNRTGGTLYTTFIDLSEMKLVVIYKLDNSKIHKLAIVNEVGSGKKRKIRLE